MRSNFIKTLIEAARVDERIFLLTGDLGFGLLEPFQDEFPSRFFNVGIAEQSLMGIASGLALSGKKVFVYSIGNFPTFRCLEQLRNDVCYHELDVTIVAQGGGFNYGGLGMSHHATEDLSVLRSMPNLRVVAPSCKHDIPEVMRFLICNGGPSYLRLEKTVIEKVSDEIIDMNSARVIVEGEDVALFATGGIVSEMLSAAKSLKDRGVSCRCIEIHTLKPLDIDSISYHAKNAKLIVTIEENNIIGGLYGAVSEVVANRGGGKVQAIGLRDQFSSVVGSQDYLRSYYKMDSQAIVDYVAQSFGEMVES